MQHNLNNESKSHPNRPKLIRDNIPAIIAAENRTIETKIIHDDEEYFDYLKKKVIEEALEVASASDITELTEEIADLQEVMEALLKLKKIPASKVRLLQASKKATRGGFEKRIVLL